MSILSPVKRIAQPFVKTKLSPTGKRVETYTHYFINESVEKKTIFYESRDGKSFTDSPLWMCLYLLKKDVDKQYTHIWSIQSSEEMTYFMTRFKEYDNVLFVERNSDEYLKWLTKAEVLINNATFQSFVTIKKEQTYINTWHGTPLKTMGFDIPGNPSDARNVVRNFFMADVLLSPNAHTTNMFLDSFRLRNNYQGVILEGGYPRMDATFSHNHDTLIRSLHERGIKLDLSKQLLLYTPTCKSGEASYTEQEIRQMISETTVLRKKFGDTYNILIKVHPFIYDKAKKEEELNSYLIPDGIDTNELLAMVDVLVTDYSSIFFDFLVTDKPIIFYCWDDDLYSHERGKYFDYDELPGPVAFNLDELIDILQHLKKRIEETHWNYERFKRLYIPYDDGNVTQRYVDYLLFNQPLSEKIKEIRQNPDKKKLLIYPGGLRKNGITTSFLNLLSNIDYEKYAVTCLLDNPKSQEQIDSIQSIPKEASLLFNFGQPVYTFSESYQDLYYHIRGVNQDKKEKFPLNIYQRDAKRLLGKTTFDVSIDFSGYSLYWTKTILGTNSAMRICYLHSDMLADMDREVNGKKIHRMNVKGIISVYDFYDKLVSVSSVICDINKKNLSNYAEDSKFVYAENLLNIPQILSTETKQEVSQTKPTQRLFREARLINPQKTVSVFDTRPDSRYAKDTTKILSEEAITVLGRFIYQEESYVKISQNGCYIGWIKEKSVTLLPDSIQSEEAIYELSKLQVGKNSQLYSQPLGLEESKVICSLDGFDELYVLLTKKVVTHTGTSYEVSNGKEPLGWIKPSTIREMSSVAMFHQKPVKKLLNTIFSATNRKRLDKLSILSRQHPINELARLTQPVSVFDKPSQDAVTKTLSANNNVILLSKNITTDWLKLQTKDDKQWYTKQSNLSLDILDEPFILSKEKMNFSAIFVQSEVMIYASIEDIFDHKGLLSRVPKEMKVRQKIQTNSAKVFYQVQLQNKQVWVSEESLTYDLSKGVMNSEGVFFDYPETTEPTFVTVGRLSEEKNQALLIDAFKLYYETYKQGHLYIIGDGPERNHLRKKIETYALEKEITMLGQVSNPYHFMKKCQVFVLTSDYEGQSLVLLEALTLKMKVISTDIPACRNVLDGGKYGMLTKTNDAHGVFKSMEAILNKKKEFKTFKPYRYNEKALQQFCDNLVKE
ncbi:CDP-glycerol glycerophosphotransferase family protein [Vagococcus bubulae]|uniref:Glycosyl transferase family 1 domain-containing protein n=1 Tax=Vagococcus bubulae TaxID=1977868 RepID=A0A429ZM54_9ENTE|nr:CDP-glycerol glycerophosphotransferase family protein [Vagococcus bubulae]RST94790.1 hypothetical protein CBF36_04480 [Vagococcus bubulae]